MTRIEALIKEVEDAPDEILAETLDFVRFLKYQRSRQADSADWMEQDLHAYAAHSLEYAARLYGDEEDLLPVEGGEENAHVSAR